MSRFWNGKRDPVERALRAARPEARDELVAHLADRVAASRPARRWSRVAFACAMTVFMLGSFASLGGLGYAASSARVAVKGITRIAKPVKQHKKLAVRTTMSSGQDQYKQPKAKPKVKPAAVKKPKAKTKAKGKAAGVFTPPPPPVKAGGELPFTGLGLGATAGLGALLLGLGVLLRRRETRKE